VAENVAGTPAFPGAIGVSHLRVYDTEAPDGLAGGTPHVHTLCTEAYAVIAGRGHVQTLSGYGYAEVPLDPGAFVWFTPGTIHRLVNDGGLEILVMMQNAGLPEAGDMVITFAPDVLADPARYADAATLPPGEQTTRGTGSAARARRDAAVTAFGALRDGGASALADFHRAAAQIVRPHLDRFAMVWADGPAHASAATGEQLAALATGDASHLAAASVHRLAPPPDERRMGCCGTLGTYIAD
jgi:mannose-6-phosphate isomerase-like protein (cupin superfamily)